MFRDFMPQDAGASPAMGSAKRECFLVQIASALVAEGAGGFEEDGALGRTRDPPGCWFSIARLEHADEVELGEHADDADAVA